jgi:acetate kinase
MADNESSTSTLTTIFDGAFAAASGLSATGVAMAARSGALGPGVTATLMAVDFLQSFTTSTLGSAAQ